MKKLLILLGLLITTLIGFSQTYNPAQATGSNKPYAPAQATPTDSRSYYYDAVTNFAWRQYQSVAEVKSYLNLAKYRTGQTSIFVHIGGTLNPDGTFTGGFSREYWFKNLVSDTSLIPKFAATYPVLVDDWSGAFSLDTTHWHSREFYNTIYQPIGSGPAGLNDSMYNAYSYIDMRRQVVSAIDTNKASSDALSAITLPNGNTIYAYIVLGSSPADRGRSDLWYGSYDGRKFIDSGKLFTTGAFKDSSTTNPHMYMWPNKDTIGMVFTVYTGATDVRTYVMKRPSSLNIGWSTPQVIMNTNGTGWIASYCNNIILASDGNFYYPYDSLLNAFPSTQNGWYVGRMLKAPGTNPTHWYHTSVNITTVDTLVGEPFIYEIPQNILNRHDYSFELVYGYRNRSGKILARKSTDFGATFSDEYVLSGAGAPNSSLYAMSADRLVVLGYNRKFLNPTDQNEVRKELVMVISSDGGHTWSNEIVLGGRGSDTLAFHEPVFHYTGKYWICTFSDIQKVTQKSALHGIVFTDEFINGQTYAIQPQYAELSVTGGAPFANSDGPKWFNVYNKTLGYDWAHVSITSSTSDNVFAYDPMLLWKASPDFETGMRIVERHGIDVDNNQVYDGAFSFQAFASDGVTPLANAPLARFSNGSTVKWSIEASGTHDFFSTNSEKAIFHLASNSSAGLISFSDPSTYRYYVGAYGTSVGGNLDGVFRIGNDDGLALFTATRTGHVMIRADRVGNSDNGYSFQIQNTGTDNKGLYADGYTRLNDTVQIPNVVHKSLDTTNFKLSVFNANKEMFEMDWPVFGTTYSVGLIDSLTKSANGAVIAGSKLVMQIGDASFPGLVSTGAQTFAGVKTLTNPIINVGSDATGDLYTRSGGLLTRIAVGAANQHLVGGTTPHWVDTAVGGGSSSDTLKIFYKGTGLHTIYPGADTMYNNTIAGLNSISLTAGSDSTRNFQLVNDTSGSMLSYYYGTNAAGRRGFYAIPTANNIYTANGTLTGSRTLSGANNLLNLGTSGSPLGGALIRSSGVIQLFGSIDYNTQGGADANITGLSDVAVIDLLTTNITANRTLTLPSSPIVGTILYIVNRNASVNNWIFSPSIKDPAGNTITNAVNGTSYTLYFDGTNWTKIN